MSPCGRLLGLVYRQIHPGFCRSGHVWGPVIRHISSLVPSVPIIPMGTHRLVCDGPPTMAACGGLLGLDYRQIHPGFCGSGHVWGPVIRHMPSLVPPVPIVLMGTGQASM